MSVPSRSVSCIKIFVEDLWVAALNLTFPAPGSASVVVVLKLYLKAAPPKFPSCHEEPELPELPEFPELPDEPELPLEPELPPEPISSVTVH